MQIRKLRFVAAADHASKRLDDALAGWLPDALARPVSRAKLRKLIMAGAVRWNGRPVRIASKTLQPGAVIEVYVDLAKLFADSTSRDKPFELTPDRILFEDDDLIVIDKPPGIPLHPTADTARDSLFAATQRYLSKRDASAKPNLGIHQRLDRDTSGVVLFTKSERVNAAVGRMFSEHQAVKIYQALTGPRSKSRQTEWSVRNYLGKVASKSKRARYGSVNNGDLAETFFRVIRETPRGMWIEAIPKTGRTHQIRVHLAEHGLPILGDDLYGSRETAPRLMLHAAELIFPHPVTGFKVTIKSPLPRDFQECLKQRKS